MDDIVSLADRHGAWILSDEVYRGAETGDDAVPGFWGRYDRVLVTNSLLQGLRPAGGCGSAWVLAPDDVAERLWARTDYTTIAPPSVSDALARIALDPGPGPASWSAPGGSSATTSVSPHEWIESMASSASRLRTPGAIAMVRYRGGHPPRWRWPNACAWSRVS